jgi:hypothetical protein
MTGESPSVAKALQALQHWAALGQEWRAAHIAQPVSWAAAQQLIEAARPLLKGESTRVRRLLEQSAQYLQPCTDPLLVDLGTHRWLAKAREEAYSDWLAWVVQCLGTPARVFPLLGAEALIPISQGLPVTVTRELIIPEGRLDLVIECGATVLLVVEVKKGSAEDAATAKQSGYQAWLTRQTHPHRQAVMLVSTAEEEVYEGFRPYGWGSLCQQLRRLAPLLCQEARVIEAALILAFVGAVEQNLLGFSSALLRRVAQGYPVLLPAAIGNYLVGGLSPAEETLDGDPGVDAT